MRKYQILAVFTALVLLALSNSFNAIACTRLVFQNDNGKTFTARTMDWFGEMKTNLWIFPRGIERSGVAGDDSYEWTSKYGSVISSGFDFATADGMNEKGLSVNLLWLFASKFPQKDGVSKTMSLAVFPQYLLDSYATVEEAVNDLLKKEFIVITGTLPGDDKLAGIHISVSDSSGDNAIIEFINEEMVIYHDRKYNILANDPPFNKMNEIFEGWENKLIGGTEGSLERFLRANYYLNTLSKDDDENRTLSAVMAVNRNISVPKNKYGLSTIWRTVADHDGLTYHFESGVNPYNMFWVDLKSVDFSENAPLKVLKLDNDDAYSGDATNAFAESEPFDFFAL